MREDPSLAGKPLIIGADPMGGRGRGVVSTASYEARRYGVHSAMPISRAYRLCPRGVYRPPRMELYVKESRRFMDILERFTDLVEPLSIDEAFLDVTDSGRLHGDGRQIATRIQESVKQELGLVASVGVAPVKFVAKIASDLRKPAGLVVVPAASLQEFLDPLPVERLFGAGPRAMERFRKLDARTLGELRRLSLERITATFGETLGHHFHRLACGVDPRPVVRDGARKSLGREQTYLEDVQDRAEVRRTALWLVDEIASALRRRGLKGRTVTVKLRTEDFHTVTRSLTLREPVDTTEEIWPAVKSLLDRADQTELAIRLVGISLSQFGACQPGLFDPPGQNAAQRIGRVLDQVARKFGRGRVVRGSLLGERPPERSFADLDEVRSRDPEEASE